MKTIEVYFSGETSPTITIKFCHSVECLGDEIIITRYDGKVTKICCEYSFIEEIDEVES